MIITISVLTLFLAKALGLYMIAAGLSGLTLRERWVRIVDGLRENAALCYVTGVLVLTIGLVLVYAHSIWTDPLAIIVSLIAWCALIEGLILIVAPEPLLKFGASLVRPGGTVPVALIAIVAGIVLMIAGFVGRAGI